MRILITGCDGQVGWELVRACQPLGPVVATGRSTLDLADPDSIRTAVRGIKPDVIINAGAYTAVDRAEDEQAAATRINADAVAVLANEASSMAALLIHYSTDYVFDGTKPGPYVEADPPAPLSAYGRTKLMGETALAASRAHWLCLRTSWIYSARGTNFLRTILRLAGEREELRVVSDQTGAPTSARLLADATAQLVSMALGEIRQSTFASSTMHVTAAGATTWYGFASRILELARQAPGSSALRATRIVPIPSDEFVTRAVRPRNSRLDCSAIERRFGLSLPDWDVGLKLSLAELGRGT
jgi:dTDP-4-dehydrorhamnose reductase